MFGIGTTELLIVLAVALMVLGPKKLPTIARTLGKAMGEFKRVSTDFQRTINTEIEREDLEIKKKAEQEKRLARAQEQAKAEGGDAGADDGKTEQAKPVENGKERAEPVAQDTLVAPKEGSEA